MLRGADVDTRERAAAAEALGEALTAAPAAAVRPVLGAAAGPLIRVAGDRGPAEVRAAVLSALGALLGRAGPLLRPFAPQLQTTFLKALADPAAGAAPAAARRQAAQNLGRLAAFAPRPDPLAKELAKAVRAALAAAADFGGLGAAGDDDEGGSPRGRGDTVRLRQEDSTANR